MVIFKESRKMVNVSVLQKLVQQEELSGFDEFLSSMNFSFGETNVTEESLASEPETIITISLIAVALILNVLAVCATYNIPNGLTTHSKLIISLAIADIFIVGSVFAHLLFKLVHEPVNPNTSTAEEMIPMACCTAFINASNNTAHLVSLLNLFMMSVDHYLAIIKPYQYSFLLNKRNGIIIIIIMWSVAIIGGFINFATGIGKDNNQLNYCEYIMYNDFHGEYLVIGCTFFSLFFIIFIYLRILHEVRQMNKRLTQLTFNHEHNSKTLVTTLLIIGTFTICYIPLFLFQIILLIHVHTDPESLTNNFRTLVTANKYLYMLLLMNSICDPIIYAVRLKEVQLGYKRFYKSFCGKFSFMGRNRLKSSSFFINLLRRQKSTLNSETGERTISMLVSENGFEKERERFISDTEADSNN